MKKLFFWTLTVVFVVGITLSGIGCKADPEVIVETVTETVVETVEVEKEAEPEEEFTPFYMTADFEPYVELPMNTKEESGDIPDEMTVAPVDRIAPETLKFAFLGGATNPFFDIIKAGVDASAETLAVHNVTVQWILPGVTLTSADYGEAIAALQVQGFNAIAGFILNEGMIPYVSDAVDSGIVFACSIADTQPNKSLFFTGSDLYFGGVTAAHAMAELTGGKGKVAIITGYFNVVAHELRRTGFVDTIAAEYPDIEIVGEVENLDQADKALTQTNDFMTAHPDLAGVYVTAGGPIGSGQAVEDAGKAGEIKVVCFDPLPQTIEYIKNGSIQAAIGQNPYAEGRDPLIRVFNYMMEGTLPDYHNMFTRADAVTIDTLEDFYASGQKG